MPYQRQMMPRTGEKVFRFRERDRSMQTEEMQFRKRCAELAEKSYRNSQYIFTDFLTEAEQGILQSMAREKAAFPAGFSLWGGHEEAERRIARFGSLEEFGYEELFPVRCIRILPLQKKFAETLTHRDYLGALMHLGLERKVIGDILVDKEEACAYVFCEAQIADFLLENIDQIRHTHMKCELTQEIPQRLVPKPEHMEIQVSSGRLDAVAAQVCHLSRSAVLELFREKKVFVNGTPMENPACQPKPGDMISVRGYGRMRFLGTDRVTRKGKEVVVLERYI